MLWAGSVIPGRGLGPVRACQGPSIRVCLPTLASLHTLLPQPLHPGE